MDQTPDESWADRLRRAKKRGLLVPAAPDDDAPARGGLTRPHRVG